MYEFFKKNPERVIRSGKFMVSLPRQDGCNGYAISMRLLIRVFSGFSLGTDTYSMPFS